MKLSLRSALGQDYDRVALERLFGLIQEQVNKLSECEIDAYHLGATAAPTTGTHKQSKFIPNTATTELGVAGAKYVIDGWRCTVSGTPGTWVARRSLTGN